MRNKSIRSVAFGAAFSVALVAVAFFATTYLGDGSHEGTTGKGGTETLPVLIDFPDGLTPDNPVEVTAELENTSGEALTFQTFPMEVETPTVPICGNNWLRLRAEGSSSEGSGYSNVIKGTNEKPLDPIPAGTNDILAGGTIWLEFNPSTIGSDQSSCEEVPVVVSGHLE